MATRPYINFGKTFDPLRKDLQYWSESLRDHQESHIYPEINLFIR
jgi:hypothetical protein